ncbi:hypothetical protein [Mesorhizobium sp. CO1-1-8]|uniref:hypothetical protein n=1 Tax=Mesorhizobium sp. CO1-1-8 TaxID=2876631 RepID=UPI001CD0988E|nr:hypothetical protein [Mesorhizobium sp. CO1-1-8]MBZ9771688.1 hypothetical protein [Mesorhizobium sp. CO1-1-8]
MSVINFLAETDALAVLPFSVVFARRKENRVTVLPYEIPQPSRSLGILRRVSGPRHDRLRESEAHHQTARECRRLGAVVQPT